MEIEVRVDGEIVFIGLAEDFWFIKDCDIELENLLDKLETMDYNSIVEFENMEIEKLEERPLWE